jgi:nucleoside-diphosphate-sugar epimerase
MRVFVTGASGHIGSAVVPELLQAGHQVVGLARSDASAARLTAAGAEVHRGDLADPDGLAAAAAAADGVIHLAFIHEWLRSGAFMDAVAADFAAIQAMGAALAGKPFVATSGTLMLAMGGIADRRGTEDDVIAGGPRVDAENHVIALADADVRSSVVRLPPIVHSTLDHHGFAPTLIALARDAGVAGYVGDGSNRWPSVHTLDAARLYRLALESAPPGARLHAVAEEGVPFRDIAGAIGRRLGVPVEPRPAEHFGFLAGFAGLDGPVTSVATRELLGWEPAYPGLLEDLAEGRYFEEPRAA